MAEAGDRGRSGVPRIIRVDQHRLGWWQVAIPERHEVFSCNSFVEARRVAARCAQRGPACELIVHDAYHRVAVHELIERSTGAPAARRIPRR